MKRHVFDLSIRSKDGKVVLQWNAGVAKWEALDQSMTVIGRRRNIETLVAVINGDREKV